MNARSDARLSLVMPELAAKVRAAADELAAAGTYLLVVSGLRSVEDQDALYAQGRSAPGHVVTNARGGQSMHNYGVAVDVVPFLAGEAGALNWKAETPQFQAMVAALKAQGLEWGGDWKGNLEDFDHFQLGGLPASPTGTMQADLEDGNVAALLAVWDKAKAGAYAV